MRGLWPQLEVLQGSVGARSHLGEGTAGPEQARVLDAWGGPEQWAKWAMLAPEAPR